MKKPWTNHTREVKELQKKLKKAISVNDKEAMRENIEKLHDIEKKQKKEYNE